MTNMSSRVSAAIRNAPDIFYLPAGWDLDNMNLLYRLLRNDEKLLLWAPTDTPNLKVRIWEKLTKASSKSTYETCC